ncbi:hypothetical protein O1611_g2625 [Lasiodiplodia mahajangana]|uniref:Uncharacterized protein n=1 Tax=Lasiodiplodia mahajangana TaxID=1108764 RepID=A0ACC2JTZ1_9PEZI|nr:hypothetical protein O1611_g2625 [Lasiodiplodia mahajangana]
MAATNSECSSGEPQMASDYRARLRAVIGALRFKDWSREGWLRIVIAVSNKRILDGVTLHMLARAWPNNRSCPLKDHWMLLSQILGEYANRGCDVAFYQVPTETNPCRERIDIAEWPAAIEDYTDKPWDVRPEPNPK